MKLEEFKSKFEDKNKDFNGNTTNVVRSYAKYLYKGAAKEISKCDVSELCAKYNYVKNSNYAEDWFYANNDTFDYDSPRVAGNKEYIDTLVGKDEEVLKEEFENDIKYLRDTEIDTSFDRKILLDKKYTGEDKVVFEQAEIIYSYLLTLGRKYEFKLNPNYVADFLVKDLNEKTTVSSLVSLYTKANENNCHVTTEEMETLKEIFSKALEVECNTVLNKFQNEEKTQEELDNYLTEYNNTKENVLPNLGENWEEERQEVIKELANREITKKAEVSEEER